MPILHIFLVLLVVLIWGCNFIFVKFSLDEVSPLLLCSLRFFLASFPAIFFIKRPSVPLRTVALYGFIMFGMQFVLLFWGMSLGVTTGLASLLLQLQIFFSLFFAALFLNEIPNRWQILGGIVSFSGIVVIGMHLSGNLSPEGFLLVIGAAASWGIGNLITRTVTKSAKDVNMISFVMWGCFLVSIPLFFIALFVEGPASLLNSIHHLSKLGVFSILYIVYGATWVGYCAWNWLLSHHSVTVVVPFTLLVPIVAIIASVLILHESFQPWKMEAAALIIMGLSINLISIRLGRKI